MIIVNNISQKEKRRLLRKNQTHQETKIWDFLRAHRNVLKWRRQVSIGPYIADFYCREKQLVIEVDGIQHLEHKEYDLERENYFKSIGIRTLRFWNREIDHNIDKVKDSINKELRKENKLDDLLRIDFET
ncbi:MAG: endonuclease protein [Patescibacteria group bacterium]|nr:endonuclease protein [Patescibacteria group bacterium]